MTPHEAADWVRDKFGTVVNDMKEGRMLFGSAYANDKTVLDLVPYTVPELKKLQKGDIVYGLHMSTGNTTLRYFRMRVNGKIKTWKTRPNDVEVPLRGNMYTWFRSIYRNSERRSGYTLYRVA